MKQTILRVANRTDRVRSNLADWSNDIWRRHKARQALRTLEAEREPLSPTHIRQANEYATEILGDRRYAPWLHVYTAVQGAFKEGWIPDNYYSRVVVPHIKGVYKNVSELSALSPLLFSNSALFPDIGYRVSGRLLTRDYRPVSPREAKVTLFDNEEYVVFKADGSSRGKGVRFIHHSEAESYLDHLPPSGVFQRRLRQHPFFDQLVPSSVSTLRITTVLNRDRAEARAAYLRLGRNSDSHVKSATQVSIPVDLSTGELGEFGYQSNWKRWTIHPDTGTAFAKLRIPSFAESLHAVICLHEQAPLIPCVGWDVAVDHEGRVNIMEWNGGYNDIKFSEATQGPGFVGLGWENLWRETSR